MSDWKPVIKKFSSRVSWNARGTCRRKATEAINTALSRMGVFVLITNADISCEEAPRLYREKDGVEKCFDSLKNNLSLKRLRVHSQEALEGLLFI